MADNTPIELWTGFDNRKLAAERARCDWKGNVLEPANDSTVSIQAGSNATEEGHFTTNQSSGSTVTIGAATSSHDGVMTSTDKSKLDGIAAGATKVSASNTNGNIMINDVDTDVYTHPDYGPASAPVSVGETTDKTPGFGETFKVLSATVDEGGHTTAIAEHEVTIPSATAVASTSGAGGTAGLMSAADKEKLDGVEAGAQANVKPDWNAAAGSDAEILNKPSIPTVNDGTLTITVAGSSTTFTANQASNASVSIPNAASASGQDPATGGLMTDTDKENLDFNTSVIPTTGQHAASTSNLLVTESGLAAAIGDFGGYKVVSGDPTTGEPVLPAGETPSPNFIYLVKDTSVQGNDKYKEWICTNTTAPYTWELVGDTSMDLSGYAQIPASKVQGNIVTFTSTNELADSGTTVASLENKIESISVNGNTQTITSKNVDLTVPVATSAIPEMDGTAAVGTSSDFARADHVHPSDTSKQDVLTFQTAYDPSTNKAATMSDVTGAVANKADKVANATAGDLAALDSNGNLVSANASVSDFKTKQTPVTDPTATGNTTSFIDTISQDDNGDITVTKKTVSTVTASSHASGGQNGLMTAQQAEALSILNSWTYAEFTDSGMGTEQTDILPRST